MRGLSEDRGEADLPQTLRGLKRRVGLKPVRSRGLSEEPEKAEMELTSLCIYHVLGAVPAFPYIPSYSKP